MRYIMEAGAWAAVGDNLLLTSAAAYKKILQMKEVPLGGSSRKKTGFAAEIEARYLLSKKELKAYVMIGLKPLFC